jgi:hypothetical protein
MFRSKWNILVVLAVCALLVPAAVSAKKQVTKPFKIQGDVMVTLAPYYASATGTATHIGKYTGSAAIQGHAILISANGDELYWDELITDIAYPNWPILDKVTFKIECTITGGTGRFENAGGFFSSGTITSDLDPIAGVLTFSYNASGTITY